MRPPGGTERLPGPLGRATPAPQKSAAGEVENLQVDQKIGLTVSDSRSESKEQPFSNLFNTLPACAVLFMKSPELQYEHHDQRAFAYTGCTRITGEEREMCNRVDFSSNVYK